MKTSYTRDAASVPAFAPLAAALTLSWISALSAGCTNSRFALSGASSTSSTSAGTSSSGSSGSGSTSTFQLASVTITAAAGGGGAGALPTIRGNFDTTQSSTSLNTVCGTGGTNPCVCQFSWVENTFTRTATTTVASVQPSAATCPVPGIWNTDIEDLTTVTLRIKSATGNSNTFTSSARTFVKAAPSAGGGGAFQDNRGNSFDNILRYSCFDQFTRGMTIKSRRSSLAANPATNETAKMVRANGFCVANISGDGSQSEDCQPMPAPDYSAQSNYYNLYIPDALKGQINRDNAQFSCPVVRESLTGISPDYYPLDSTFALATSRSADFNVGVEAFGVIPTTSGDAGSLPTSCDSAGAPPAGGGGGGAVGSLPVKKCLGFARRPTTEGTCAPITLSNGLTVPTYRLRRFVALYPPVYDTDGKMITSQLSDTNYVIDRPVNFPGQNPMQPYTMRGPKPCPYAYFDHKGLLGDSSDANYGNGGIPDPSDPARIGMPNYVATSHAGWNGVNVDGVQFPNVDIPQLSCSAVIPVFNRTTNIASLATVNPRNPVFPRLYVRPIQSWSPHYEEDTSFQACTPLSNVFRDPPLHFSRDPSTGNVHYCAEAYPSQNPNVRELEFRRSATAQFPGMVPNFTSHVVKNSQSSICSATVTDLSRVYSPSSTPAINDYPAPPAAGNCPTTYNGVSGTAWHPNTLLVDDFVKPATSVSTFGATLSGTQLYACSHLTCDRTVASGEVAYKRFPLVARAPQVETAIGSDSTFACMISWDNNSGKAGRMSPSAGCCGASVYLDTGVSAGTTRLQNRTAHLELDIPCQTPTY